MKINLVTQPSECGSDKGLLSDSELRYCICESFADTALPLIQLTEPEVSTLIVPGSAVGRDTEPLVPHRPFL
jgi:hypothetical protein